MKSNLAIVFQKYLGYLALLFALGGFMALPVGAQVNTASSTGQRAVSAQILSARTKNESVEPVTMLRPVIKKTPSHNA